MRSLMVDESKHKYRYVLLDFVQVGVQSDTLVRVQ